MPMKTAGGGDKGYGAGGQMIQEADRAARSEVAKLRRTQDTEGLLQNLQFKASLLTT